MIVSRKDNSSHDVRISQSAAASRNDDLGEWKDLRGRIHFLLHYRGVVNCGIITY